MHAAALAFIAAHLPSDADAVLEFGSRNVNGTARDLCPTVSRYVGVDVVDGPGADVVADAATVSVPGVFDVVICAEVFEHATDVECKGMTSNAAQHLRSGGLFIATMGGPGRPEHSAIDGGRLYAGEHYRNVTPELLTQWLNDAGFTSIVVDTLGDDVRCAATR